MVVINRVYNAASVYTVLLQHTQKNNTRKQQEAEAAPLDGTAANVKTKTKISLHTHAHTHTHTHTHIYEVKIEREGARETK